MAEGTKIKGAPPRKCRYGNRGRAMNGRGHLSSVRYWGEGRRDKRKVRNIQRDYAKSGRTLTVAEATAIWRASRTVAA